MYQIQIDISSLQLIDNGNIFTLSIPTVVYCPNKQVNNNPTKKSSQKASNMSNPVTANYRLTLRSNQKQGHNDQRISFTKAELQSQQNQSNKKELAGLPPTIDKKIKQIQDRYETLVKSMLNDAFAQMEGDRRKRDDNNEPADDAIKKESNQNTRIQQTSNNLTTTHNNTQNSNQNPNPTSNPFAKNTQNPQIYSNSINNNSNNSNRYSSATSYNNSSNPFNPHRTTSNLTNRQNQVESQQQGPAPRLDNIFQSSIPLSQQSRPNYTNTLPSYSNTSLTPSLENNMRQNFQNPTSMFANSSTNSNSSSLLWGTSGNSSANSGGTTGNRRSKKPGGFNLL